MVELGGRVQNSDRRTPPPNDDLRTPEPGFFLGKFDPLRQMMARKAKNLHISREIRPPPPTVWVGGGGWYCEIMLDIRTFLAFRQWSSWRKAPFGPFQPSIVT